MTRSGCASTVRPKGRCPLISAKGGIGHTNSSHFRDEAKPLSRSASFSYARGWRKTTTPSTTPPQRGRRMPGLELVSKAAPGKAGLREHGGTGMQPVPLRADPPAGATDAGGMSPNSCQPFPSGKATKRVLSPFFTRIRTLRLPSVRAPETTSRTSAGVETDLPAISRMTSPVEKP